MILRIANIISSGFGSGCVPRAPGTIGTLVAVAVWVLLSWLGVLSSYVSHGVLAVTVVIVGTMAVRSSLEEEGGEDPQWIVIDEWAGVFIALIGTDPTDVVQILGAFACFRFFDILKPGPVSLAEELPGAFGIVADDVVAGVLSLIGLAALRALQVA